MRKIFVIAILLVWGIGNADAGGQPFRIGPSGSCAVDDEGDDEFWYCGDQTKGCDGIKDHKKDKRTWYQHEGHFTKGGKTYWCCTPDYGNTQGTWKQGDKWVTETKTHTETFEGGGRCTWYEYKNICGHTTGTKCEEPEPGNCDVGYFSFNGKCVPACKSGFAHTSKQLPECVECPTTLFQGIVYKPINVFASNSNKTADYRWRPVCEKCDQTTQFFQKEFDTNGKSTVVEGTTAKSTDTTSGGSCVKKGMVKSYSKTNFNACWECEDEIWMKACLEYQTTGQIKQKEPGKTTVIAVQKMKDSCHITDQTTTQNNQTAE